MGELDDFDRGMEHMARAQLEQSLEEVKAKARALLPNRAPRRGDDARMMNLFAAYADAVTGLSHLQRGNVIRAGSLAARAWMRFDRRVEQQRSRAGFSSGKERTSVRQRVWDKWQSEADALWRSNPSLSKTAVAQKIERKLAGEHNWNSYSSFNAIRLRIVKPDASGRPRKKSS
jgi:hypothetical protein